MTISWAGGNDYCAGKVNGLEIFYIERIGPRWVGYDWSLRGATVEQPVAEGRTMREAQEGLESWHAKAAA